MNIPNDNAIHNASSRKLLHAESVVVLLTLWISTPLVLPMRIRFEFGAADTAEVVINRGSGYRPYLLLRPKCSVHFCDFKNGKRLQHMKRR